MNQNDNDSGNDAALLAEAGGTDADRSRRLGFAIRALGRTPVSIFYQSSDLTYQWAENVPDAMGGGDVVGRTDHDLLPSLAADRLTASKLKVLEAGDPQRFELPVNLGGEVRWFDVWIDPDRDQGNRVAGVFTTLIEMTDQKRREVQLKNLLREVSHRSKNLLAIVLSLASQTARSSSTLSGFVGAFSGRLQAIARAQDLVTDRDWRGALMSDLISRQLALFRGDKALPVKVSGEDLVISPSAALYVGLAIHELAANSVRSGQLVALSGSIDVSTRIETLADGGRALVLEWSELGAGTGGEMEPLTRAFLENVVPLAVEGSGSLAADGEGMRYVLKVDGVHIA
ncbi:sensor histidine kinase [Pelagibacterium montanilacus]|uniref:sensor histidine kinase n=1 Tax=Pelagibacterium montanilacus TaxID=2185280 RepID=UPI0013E0D3E4|nr:HWE histidine kinase domain-containing protein [Pelagibacterium montanilacus]